MLLWMSAGNIQSNVQHPTMSNNSSTHTSTCRIYGLRSECMEECLTPLDARDLLHEHMQAFKTADSNVRV